ncbi:serine hydrolase-domain-containing protein [Papiliotrema laurentii]|uniref:Serine hydrolase-domain-containing protein n=1 Tax=Papiliotrema laurentii TaxID=5418 RepID=A0AAD9FV76_PAPLA|nr:serine hydrolase-domain-containing protein [Papiliotrema laurentii]
MVVRVLALCKLISVLDICQVAHLNPPKLGGIRKACKDVEFVFLEPSIVVQKVDMPWASSMDDFDSVATTEEEQQTPETTPRAWWLSSGDRQTYRRFDESVEHIHKALVEQGPFDGVMGFSQGGCMAMIVAALTEKPGLHPKFPAEPSVPKMKFVISVGGFLPAAQSPSFDAYWPLPAHLPVLSVVGRNDTVVPAERSHTLEQGAENYRVEYHEGGHFTPSKASWRHFLNAYITSFAEGGSKGDVGPPSSFGPSGASTPATASATPRSMTPVPKAKSCQPDTAAQPDTAQPDTAQPDIGSSQAAEAE